MAKHKLVTPNEAVVVALRAEGAPEANVSQYLSSAATRSRNDARALANELLGSHISFSCDVPRTREGCWIPLQGRHAGGDQAHPCVRAVRRHALA